MKNVLVLILVLVFSLTIYVNYLAGAGQLNNIGTGELSDLYPTLFTPAGFTFSIWGVIYLFNTIFCVIQIIRLFKSPSSINTKLILDFLFVCIFNVAWLVTWHYELLLLSVIVMLMLLSSLIYGVIESRRHRLESKQNYFEYINFSVYLGWISVATIANVSAYLYTLEFAPDLQVELTILMIVIAAILALFFSFKLGNYAFGLVVVWALFGIHKARITDPSDGVNLIALLTLICMALILLSMARKWSKKMVK
ncbi:MAG: hypothetical protein ACI905_002223 [Roseivirga sp.]|jgi:hypothetical protein